MARDNTILGRLAIVGGIAVAAMLVIASTDSAVGVTRPPVTTAIVPIEEGEPLPDTPDTPETTTKTAAATTTTVVPTTIISESRRAGAQPAEILALKTCSISAGPCYPPFSIRYRGTAVDERQVAVAIMNDWYERVSKGDKNAKVYEPTAIARAAALLAFSRMVEEEATLPGQQASQDEALRAAGRTRTIDIAYIRKQLSAKKVLRSFTVGGTKESRAALLRTWFNARIGQVEIGGLTHAAVTAAFDPSPIVGR